MKSFRYEGISSSGAPIQGVVEAADKNDAIRKAKENCRVLVKLEPVSGGKMNDLMNAVNSTITFNITGELPSDCTHNCSTCGGGCH